ncbi:MAG: RagB/SusD family nutrient uptake outer membrane protein, partial [Parabacteroides sp.]|nr:RagB/SusD family nutrient uptake outer membrane protein [Parabacteroides sp.]
MKDLRYSALALLILVCSSCSNFLDEQLPQGTLSDEQVKDPQYIENLIISAYAIFISAEDINSSFSMWNFDVRSDDAYKGGNGTSDGDVFHQLEVSQGILTTNWNLNDMWQRLYNSISRVNTAIALLNEMDDSYSLKQQRLGEMKFLRA